MIGITVLGATGSIGVSTLDVIALHPEKYEIVALTAHRQIDRLAAQCQQFQPRYAVVGSDEAANQLSAQLSNQGLSDIQVLVGVDNLEKVAALPEVDYVMAAIVGAAGLKPTLAAARAGKRVLLANKEALVMSGDLFIETVKVSGAKLLPIDSEHNAIFQCMPGRESNILADLGVKKILLTASGGPFLEAPLDKLQSVTPDEAIAHPNWSMGRKISVDSATMMNKGLEVIEARWLFNATPGQIQVVIHPQSVIHSLVQYIDGSVLAQLGNPDMRTPIAHCLAWPERITSGVADLDLFDVARLDFETVDFARFPCLRLAYEALEIGGSASAILNAANEVAVDCFLNEKIPFTDIPKIIEQTMQRIQVSHVESIEQVLAVDAEARAVSAELSKQNKVLC